MFNPRLHVRFVHMKDYTHTMYANWDRNILGPTVRYNEVLYA